MTANPLMLSPTGQPKDVFFLVTRAKIVASRGWPRNRSTASPAKDSSVNANPASPSPSAQPLAAEFPATEPKALSATIRTTSPEHMAPKNQVNQSTFYASMVDPDEGNNLDFIPAAKINGVACAHLASEDVEEEIACWSSSVLCSVLGAEPPFVII